MTEKNKANPFDAARKEIFKQSYTIDSSAKLYLDKEDVDKILDQLKQSVAERIKEVEVSTKCNKHEACQYKNMGRKEALAEVKREILGVE